MKSTTIVAIIPLSQANGLIDNLVEADFSEKNISLISENVADARRIVDDKGPLKGETAQSAAEALTRLGFVQATDIAKAITTNTALIALSVDAGSSDAAKEMLNAAGATHLEEM